MEITSILPVKSVSFLAIHVYSNQLQCVGIDQMSMFLDQAVLMNWQLNHTVVKIPINPWKVETENIYQKINLNTYDMSLWATI